VSAEDPDNAAEGSVWEHSPAQLRERLREAVGADSYRAIAARFGNNPEWVRFQLHTLNPSARFLSGVCDLYGISGDWLLLGRGPKRREGCGAGGPLV